MTEMKTLQAAMRTAADDPALNPLQRSGAIARHRAAYQRKADELRLESRNKMGPQVERAESLRQQIAGAKASTVRELRDPSLTDEQRHQILERHTAFVLERAHQMRTPKPSDSDEPFSPY